MIKLKKIESLHTGYPDHAKSIHVTFVGVDKKEGRYRREYYRAVSFPQRSSPKEVVEILRHLADDIERDRNLNPEEES